MPCEFQGKWKTPLQMRDGEGGSAVLEFQRGRPAGIVAYGGETVRLYLSRRMASPILTLPTVRSASASIEVEYEVSVLVELIEAI